MDTDNFSILNKPQGYSTQGGQPLDKNIFSIFKNYYHHLRETQNLRDVQALIVHRLDRVTSGVLLITKNKKYSQIFGKLLQERENIQKLYVAVVSGEVSQKRGVIRIPLSFDSSKQKAVIGDHLDPTQECTTYFEVVGYFQTLQDGRTSFSPEILERGTPPTATLLRLQIREGRKHQIRAHLQYGLSLSIFRDTRYGYLGVREPPSLS